MNKSLLCNEIEDISYSSVRGNAFSFSVNACTHTRAFVKCYAEKQKHTSYRHCPHGKCIGRYRRQSDS